MPMFIAPPLVAMTAAGKVGGMPPTPTPTPAAPFTAPPRCAMIVARLALSILIPLAPSSWSSFQLADVPSGAVAADGAALLFGSALQ